MQELADKHSWLIRNYTDRRTSLLEDALPPVRCSLTLLQNKGCMRPGLPGQLTLARPFYKTSAHPPYTCCRRGRSGRSLTWVGSVTLWIAWLILTGR